MWIWSASGKTLVNAANVLTIDLAETWDSAGDKYAVRAHVTGDYTELKTGTEAECKAYLEQLDLDLAEQGDRVAVAAEAQVKALQALGQCIHDMGMAYFGS